MKKRVLLLFLLVCVMLLPAYAFEEREHEEWTEAILFGNPSFKSYKTNEIRESIEKLENAVYLCIDQFNHNGETKFERLQQFNIPGFPSSLDEIDFTAGGGSKYSGHRVYTHRGWNHVYTDQKGHPEARKQLLLNAVRNVFGFDGMTDERADKVCDAMCCLLYAVHILGDRYGSTTYYGAANTMLLADRSSTTETVIYDLLYAMEVLFPEQKKAHDTGYVRLYQTLEDYEREILSRQKKAAKDTELLAIDQEYAVCIKNALQQYLPDLLYQQSWFTDVFPEKWR